MSGFPLDSFEISKSDERKSLIIAGRMNQTTTLLLQRPVRGARCRSDALFFSFTVTP
jgi:hypothetical protein